MTWICSFSACSACSERQRAAPGCACARAPGAPAGRQPGRGNEQGLDQLARGRSEALREGHRFRHHPIMQIQQLAFQRNQRRSRSLQLDQFEAGARQGLEFVHVGIGDLPAGDHPFEGLHMASHLKEGDKAVDIVRVVARQAQQARRLGRIAVGIQLLPRRPVEIVDADGRQIIPIGLRAPLIQIGAKRQHGVAEALAPQTSAET